MSDERRPKGSINRPQLALRALAAAPDGELLTTELVANCGEQTVQKALSWYGNILRRHEEAGLVERAGREVRGWGKGTVGRWKITPAGVDLVLYWDEQPARQAAADEAEAAAKAKDEKKKEALANARETSDRAAPRHLRRQIALELRTLGCSLGEIGEVFSVSREMIRQDLLLPEDWRARRRGTSTRARQGLKSVTNRCDKFADFIIQYVPDGPDREAALAAVSVARNHCENGLFEKFKAELTQDARRSA